MPAGFKWQTFYSVYFAYMQIVCYCGFATSSLQNFLVSCAKIGFHLSFEYGAVIQRVDTGNVIHKINRYQVYTC